MSQGGASATESAKTAAHKARLAYQILGLTLILRPFGNLCLAWGTKHLSQVLAANPLVYLQAMLNPFVALGVILLIVVTLLRIALLSVADLSFVVPLTAIGYIISTLLGKFVLAEQITVSRWSGIFLICAGTALVSTTSRKIDSTTQDMKHRQRECYETIESASKSTFELDGAEFKL